MSIREIPAAAITDAVEALCIEANTRLPADVKAALDAAEAAEPWPLAKETLGLLQQNLCVAKEKDLPICQDTGMACVFIELGQDAHIDGDLTDAVNEHPGVPDRASCAGQRLQNHRRPQGRGQ